MRLLNCLEIKTPDNRSLGFTLAEVVVSIAIVAGTFLGIIGGYIQSSTRAEWSGYSLAAQALAIQQLEQARSAKWDVLDTPVVNEITNISLVTAAPFDLPVSSTNFIWATNYSTLTSILVATNPVVSVYMVKVQTVWPFPYRGKTIYFTNTVAGYFAPDR
jgi:type II secretory pathway pseudopilin PulG